MKRNKFGGKSHSPNNKTSLQCLPQYIFKNCQILAEHHKNARLTRPFHLNFKNFSPFFPKKTTKIAPNHLQNNTVLSNLNRWAQRANLAIVKKLLQFKNIKPCLRRPGQSIMLLTFEGLKFGVFLITHWKILGLSQVFTFPHCTEIKIPSLTFWSIHFLIFPPVTSEASCSASHNSDPPLLKPDLKILKISAGSLEDPGCECTFIKQGFHLWSQRLKKK